MATHTHKVLVNIDDAVEIINAHQRVFRDFALVGTFKYMLNRGVPLKTIIFYIVRPTGWLSDRVPLEVGELELEQAVDACCKFARQYDGADTSTL